MMMLTTSRGMSSIIRYECCCFTLLLLTILFSLLLPLELFLKTFMMMMKHDYGCAKLRVMMVRFARFSATQTSCGGFLRG